MWSYEPSDVPATALAVTGTPDSTTFLRGDNTWSSPSGGGSGSELDYVEFTAPVSPTATTEATANTVVTSSAVVFDGSTTIFVEFFAPAARPAAATGVSLDLWLYDGGTSLGRIGFVNSQNGNNANTPVDCRRRLTPSAASHTYSIRASVSGGTGSVTGGAGGAGNFVPGFIRIVTA